MNDKKDSLLPKGCYFVQYRPKKEIDGVKHFDGVLRYTPDNERIKASADLYEHPTKVKEGNSDFPTHCKELPNEMPVFPRDTYRFYFEVQQFSDRCPDDKSVSLRFQVHEYDAVSKRFIHRGGRSAILTQKDKLEKSEKGMRKPFFIGNVFDERTSEPVGEMQLSLVRERFVRQAVVQIDSEGGIPLPLTNGIQRKNRDYCDWKKLFADCDWEVKQPRSSRKSSDSGKLDDALKRAWTDAELHEKMRELSRSGESKAESEWRYHLLCVGKFANPQYERGVMYDVGGSDLNQSPREGAAIAAGWSLEDWSKKWPNLKKKDSFYQAKDLYFRTAVHEIGHALGLGHSHDGAHFMNTTDALEGLAFTRTRQAVKDKLLADAQIQALEKMPHDAANETVLADLMDSAEKESESADEEIANFNFPINIKCEFSDRDKDRLQHGPDVMVRSGTFVEGAVAGFGDSELMWADGLELRLTPLLESVPLGALVRVRLTLKNVSDREQQVPANLHLKGGFVEGTVFGPGGHPARPFYPIMRSMDSDRVKTLGPGDALHHSMTLLRGHEGPLFRGHGDHRIRVRVSWSREGRDVYLENETWVRVEAATDMAHQMAASNLLNSPDTLLGLALGKDDAEVRAAIDACLKVPVLRPHYEVLRLKRWLRLSDPPDPLVINRLQGGVVLSVSEVNSLLEALKVARPEFAELKNILEEKMRELLRAE